MLLTFPLSNNNGDGYENVTYIKSGFALLTTSLRLFHLVQFVKCLEIFFLYRSSGIEKESRCLVFSPSTKREIIHFHVKVMQWRQRDVHKIATQVRINLLLNVLVSFTRPQLLFNHICVSVITNLCFIPV